MSGRKQHYIPQFLLRQFAANKTKKSTQVFVYKRGKLPFICATEGVAAQRDFYSSKANPNTQELDDQITSYENKLALMLESLRSSNAGTVNAEIAAEVVTHLTTRGAFIRDLFSSAFQEAIFLTYSILQTKESSQALFGTNDIEPTEHLTNAISSIWNELPYFVSSHLPKPLFQRLVTVLFRENFDEIHSSFVPQLQLTLEELQRKLPLMAQRGHAKALAIALAPDERLKTLASLVWHIKTYTSGSLVLPDCVALTELPDGSLGPLQIQENEKLSCALIPLSDRCLLIGISHNSKFHDPTADDFNHAAAASCWDFFVAARESEALLVSSSLIRNRPHDFINTKIDEAAKDFYPSINESTKKQPDSDIQLNSIKSQTKEFNLCLFDFGDKNLAKSVGPIIAAIAESVGNDLPLNRLESITFANDYAAALRNLDRGDARLGHLAATEDDCGVGISMAPLVVRDGEIRACIIVRDWIATALLDKTNDNHNTAVHVLIRMMARVAFIEILDTALPGKLLQPISDAWSAFLFKQIDDVCAAYFSARVAAPVMPEIGGSFRSLFCDVLRRANRRIPKARLEYRTHGQLDVLLEEVAAMTSPILIHCASLIGHFDGLNLNPLDDQTDLSIVLQESDLGRWFEVFSHDLRKNYSRTGKWSSFQEFMFLTVHVERQLWRFGIFPWRNEDGMVRVEIPIGTDAEALAEHIKAVTE